VAAASPVAGPELSVQQPEEVLLPLVPFAVTHQILAELLRLPEPRDDIRGAAQIPDRNPVPNCKQRPARSSAGV